MNTAHKSVSESKSFAATLRQTVLRDRITLLVVTIAITVVLIVVEGLLTNRSNIPVDYSNPFFDITVSPELYEREL